MVYTVMNYRNDAIKCSKLKWNHELQASDFTAKFWTFYGIIFMVYKSAYHEKVWSIRFLQQQEKFLAEFALFSVAKLSKLKARARCVGNF